MTNLKKFAVGFVACLLTLGWVGVSDAVLKGTAGYAPGTDVSYGTITATTAFVAPTGASNATSYRFANQSNLYGFYASSATTVSVAINNSESMRWASTGIPVFKGVATAASSLGIPVIYGYGRSTAQTGAVGSVATFTPAADGTFQVSANVLVTTATTHAFTVTCAYTDEGNTARTLTLPFTLVAGSAIVTSVANANGAVPYMGISLHIRAKAGTAITIATTGTFTTVTYNVEGVIKQIS